MTADGPAPAVQHFVDYFGELGPRWGLPADACRVHAYLYLVAAPVTEARIRTTLLLDAEQLTAALAFLIDYRMAERLGVARWRTSGDPWDMLLRGLEQRRRRELPAALSTLRDCHREALADGSGGRSTAAQIGKMLSLVEDLAAIDTQARRLSPRVLKGLVGVSGRAARFMDRAFGARGGKS